MKTKLIALFLSITLVLVLAACGSPAPTAAPEDTGSEATEVAPVDGGEPAASDVVAKFDFNNTGAVDICELYLSPAGTETWGPDQLQGQTIAAGGKFTLTNIPANTYDVKWVGCDKTEGTTTAEIKNP